MNTHIIIPAGGSGIRFGGKDKKQFLTLGGESILNQVISLFDKLSFIKSVSVSLPFDEIDRQVENPDCFYQSEKVHYMIGGKTRSASVYQGFIHLKKCQDDDVVLIHDAVRPLVSQSLVEKIIETTKVFGACVPALKMTDTVKRASRKNMVIETIPRHDLHAVQTPQGFLYGKLKEAYDSIDYRDGKYTDEAMLMELTGVPVKIVEGDVENIKITAPFDLKIAEEIWNAKKKQI